MRTLGYFFRDDKNGESDFVKVLGRDGYPRFHLYIKKENDNLIFNLHLDQKRPTYKGTAAHSGEYDDEGFVGKEAERIKQTLKNAKN